MNSLQLSPILAIDEDRFSATTPWLARLLWLFSYSRVVTVDRKRQRITITTTRLWRWCQTQTIDFDHISRIVYQGQGMPSLMFWRYASDLVDGCRSAIFLISLALKDHSEVQPLFTIWENQPREHDWLDRLAGSAASPMRLGDEASVRVVDLLHDYLRVPIARH